MIPNHLRGEFRCALNTGFSNLIRQKHNNLPDMNEREKIATLMKISSFKSLGDISASNIEDIIKGAFTFNNGGEPSQDLKNAAMFFAIAVDTATHGRLNKVAYFTLRHDIDGIGHQLAASIFNLTEINTDEDLQENIRKKLDDLNVADTQLAIVDEMPSYTPANT